MEPNFCQDKMMQRFFNSQLTKEIGRVADSLEKLVSATTNSFCSFPMMDTESLEKEERERLIHEATLAEIDMARAKKRWLGLMP